MATASIQARLSQELEKREALELAFTEGMAYLSGPADRNVFPTDEALADLRVFDEDLPTEPKAATEVVELLARYGAPVPGGSAFTVIGISVSSWATSEQDVTRSTRSKLRSPTLCGRRILASRRCQREQEGGG